jgi:hypothetical protein
MAFAVSPDRYWNITLQSGPEHILTQLFKSLFTNDYIIRLYIISGFERVAV